MKSFLGFLGSILILLLVMLIVEYFTYYVPVLNALPTPGTGTRSADFVNNIDWVRVIIQVLSLLVGIFASHIVSQLKKLAESGVTEINILTEFGKIFKAVDFYIALFSSPLVFSIIIVSTDGAPLLMSTVFAFQNGFFWKTVIPSKPKPINP